MSAWQYALCTFGRAFGMAFSRTFGRTFGRAFGRAFGIAFGAKRANFRKEAIMAWSLGIVRHYLTFLSFNATIIVNEGFHSTGPLSSSWRSRSLSPWLYLSQRVIGPFQP